MFWAACALRRTNPGPLSLDSTALNTATIAEPVAAGERIGRYKLLQQIGEGGFGVVWVAEQEEPVRRRVALKIIKLGMDTKEVDRALRAGAAGAGDDGSSRTSPRSSTPARREPGRPFFVMELVRGIKITDYCDQANLPTAERLELFIAGLPGGAARAPERASSTATSSRRTSSSRCTTACRCRRSSTSASPRRRSGSGSPT